MTYSLGHAKGEQRLTTLLDTLDNDVFELRRLLTIYGDVQDLPGRGPEIDPERTGRQATHGPSRPTEVTALDPARSNLRTALESGVTRVARAIALVRGTSAEMDRALHEWEGVVPARVRGTHGGTGGAARDII